jgi:hypothetical protein
MLKFAKPALHPPSEAWGMDGFTVTDRDAAFKKLKQMSPGGPAKPTGTDLGTYPDKEPN